MSSYVQLFNDKYDFIEFKTNILLLKQPHHKASVFAELTLDKFIEIRDLTNSYSELFISGDFSTFSCYEAELYNIFASFKSYPNSSMLVVKALLGNSCFESFEY